MQRYELDAWLGDDHGLNDDQVSHLLTAADAIDVRYPDPDDADDREAALLTAYRLLVEDKSAVLADLSAQLLQARLAKCAALAAIRQCAVTLVQAGGKGARGIGTAAGFAAAAGVDRQAVLGWLGRR